MQVRSIYRVFAWSIIGQPPAACTPIETQEWVEIIKNDPSPERRKEHVNKLILGHIRFVGSIAAYFTSKVPTKSADIMAYALCRLVEITNRISYNELMKGHTNYDAYLQFTLRREIARYLNQDYIVVPAVNDPRVLEEIRQNREDFIDRYKPRTLSESANATPAVDFPSIVRDLVGNSQMFTTREQELITYKIEGLEDVEIAAKMGITKQRVGQIKEGLRTRLELLTGIKT